MKKLLTWINEKIKSYQDYLERKRHKKYLYDLERIKYLEAEAKTEELKAKIRKAKQRSIQKKPKKVVTSTSKGKQGGEFFSSSTFELPKFELPEMRIK